MSMEYPGLKVYTCTGFEGVWPVGTAAVVVAYGAGQAEGMLRRKLAAIGLPQRDNTELKMELLNQDTIGVVVLCNGDY